MSENKKSLPKFAAPEGFSFSGTIAFSGQLFLLLNNYDNRVLNVFIHNIVTTKKTVV